MGAPACCTCISALALLPALAGMLTGQSLRARVRPELFRVWFLIALLLPGADLALRAFA